MLSMVREALGDRYTVEREIGRGGAARVFLAQDREGRNVALKILHPELALSVTAQRFLREISMLAKLQHPHIAQMLDYGELDYLVYYAMRFIEGQNLRVHIDRARRISVPDTVRLASDLLDALATAHRVSGSANGDTGSFLRSQSPCTMESMQVVTTFSK